jgi:regulator of sigma E protease
MELLNQFATNTGALILVLGIIIFVHEFGHFITAKAFGMRVFIFSFGFGKRLFGFKWGDTDCRVSAIPLGGYVKLEGEPDDRLSEDVGVAGDGRDFTARPRWQRIVVYLAGPAMNVLLTVSALTYLYSSGWRVDGMLYDRPVIGAVDPVSPAAAAGLHTGDEILTVDGRPVKTWEDAAIAIHLRPDSEMSFRVRRGSEEKDVSLRTRVSEHKGGEIGAAPLVRVGEIVLDSPAAKAGFKEGDGLLRIGETPIRTFADVVTAVRGAGGQGLDVEVYRNDGVVRFNVVPIGGRIGIGSHTVLMHFPLRKAFLEACKETWRQIRQIVGLIRDLLTARASPRAAFQGPVEMAKVSGQAVQGGPRVFLWVVALISISVGILNLFPLPPLDGGHLAVLLIEGIARRDVSVAVKMWMINAGAVLLLLLIAMVLYSDLSKTAILGKYLN